MRLPFPNHVPFGPSLAALSLVLVVQLMEGTDPVFALLMLVAQACAIGAFNMMGGLTHMTGAFCLFAVLPCVTVPELAHLLLGQPGDFNLMHPVETAAACAVFFACVLVAARMVSLIKHPVALLDLMTFSVFELRVISICACVVATVTEVKVYTLDGPLEEGSLLAALHHFSPYLLAVSVMMAALVRREQTGGRSLVSWYIVCLLLLAIVPGMLFASKEGILTPFLCWLVVAAASRHRFSLIGTAVLAGVFLLIWLFVYPFSQNARVPVRAAISLADKAEVIGHYFSKPSDFPDVVSTSDASAEFGTSTPKVGIVARYSDLPSMDMLIDGDQKLGYTGINRYLPVFVSLIPHALWPDRPAPVTSNELGHKAGYPIAASDTTTGIAIGSPALFFDIGGWLALIVYTLLFFMFFFLVARRIVGSSATSVWGLVLIGTEANLAGNAGPSEIFGISVLLPGMLFVMVALLKTVSKPVEVLTTRPSPNTR